MKRRVLLLGLGAQGQAALYDLIHHDPDTIVTVLEQDPGLKQRLTGYPESRVIGVVGDVSDTQFLSAHMTRADVVIEALPSPFAFAMGDRASLVGVPLVSSMYYRDPQETDPKARSLRHRRMEMLQVAAQRKHLTILTEFGLDPGLDVIMAVRAIAEFEEVHEVRMHGAGLPELSCADNPLRYRFSWSPAGVLRSYARPARVIRDGELHEIPPESIFESDQLHLLDVPGLAEPLECFPNGDAAHYANVLGIAGRVRNMGRYTGRWPGHAALWNALSKLGFLERTPVEARGARVVPLEFMADVLASQSCYQFGAQDRDLAFVRVEVRGMRQGRRTSVAYELLDYRDLTTGLTAMQRTVGFTLALGARLILDGPLARQGLLGPADVPYDLVFPALETRGIRVRRIERPWE